MNKIYMGKKYKSTLIVCFCLLGISVFGQSSKKNKVIGHWTYCDGYTFKYLTLKRNRTFVLHFNSCSGDETVKGKYKFYTDTIIIKGEEVEKMLYRNNKIYDYPGENGVFPEFQPLSKTKKSNIKRAYHECGKQRKSALRKILKD